MRIGWDDYFLNIAEEVKTRSTCTRLHVGCVIINNKRIVSTGFNGSISGHAHCEDVGCLLNDEGRCIRTLHAEENAILEGERHLLKGATAYITHEPCEKCAKSLAQAGIKRIVFRHAYPNKWNEHFLQNITVCHLPKGK